MQMGKEQDERTKALIMETLRQERSNKSKSFVNKMNGLTESVINEAPEKDTYWMITKANRDNLIKMGGTAEEIGKSATNNFKKYCK